MTDKLARAKQSLLAAVNELQRMREVQKNTRAWLDYEYRPRRPDPSIDSDPEDFLPYFHSTMHPAFEGDKALIKAFEFCKLNPRKFSHWRLLLEAFAIATFRDDGRPQRWTESAVLELLKDLTVILDKEPDLIENNSELARRVRQNHRGKYADLSRLRRVVAVALKSDWLAAIDARNERAKQSFLQQVDKDLFGLGLVLGGAADDAQLRQELIAATMMPNHLRPFAIDQTEAEKIYGRVIDKQISEYRKTNKRSKKSRREA